MKLTRVALYALLLSSAVTITQKAKAVPYASGVTNNAGTISFLLNESADNVKVLFNNGASTNDLGALPAGRTSFSLGAATNYQIVVTKTSTPGYFNTTGSTQVTLAGSTKITNFVAVPLQINSDSNSLWNFNSPRGIAINRNPSSPYFGRVYVANSTSGASTPDAATGGVARTLGDGIYAINPDGTDPLGLGDTASTGGIDFSGGNQGGNSPWRMTVGQDDTLYISDWSTNTGNLYYIDANLQSGGFALKQLASGTFASTPVGAANNHGRVSSVAVEGSRAAGNLKIYTIDTDLQQDKTATALTQANSLWRYDVNSGSFPYTADPAYLWSASAGTLKEGLAGFTSQQVDLERGTNGYFYIDTYRSAGAECGIAIRNGSTTGSGTGANTLFSSYKWSTNTPYRAANDILNSSYAMAVSPDLAYMAVLNVTNFVWILPMTNGIPDLSRRLFLSALPPTSQSRSIRFDAANNLYVVSSGEQLVRVFSPGGLSITKTFNDVSGTNGSFSLQLLPAINSAPQDLVTNAGATVVLSVVASGASLTYQWQFNNANVANATNSTLTLSNVQRTSNYGAYKCIVTSIYNGVTNTVTSQPAVVTVTDTVPIITAQSSDTTTNAGTSPKFTVTAIGTTALTYQWYFNGTAIPGATTSAYTVSNVQQANAGTYAVNVANPIGVTPSADILLQVTPTAPVISTQPKSGTYTTGTNLTLSVVSTGTDPKTYQWSKDGANILDATNSTFNINPTQVTDSGSYVVTIQNSEGSTPSSAASITINDTPTPTFTTQPKGLTNGAGVNLTFTAVAMGNPTMAYQWYTNGVAADGATNTSFTWVNPQVEDSGANVYVIADNGSQNQSSTVVIGVTNKAPTIVTAPVDFVGNLGGTATNVVIAQGENPLFYQWRLNGTNVAGANSSALVLNNLQLSDAGSYTVVVSNATGSVTSGAGLLSVAQTVTPGTGTGLIGEYFTSTWYLFASANNSNSITATPTLTRVDTNIDFTWGTGSPDPSISSDYFVIRWTGQVQPLYSDNYTFYIKSDDGVRLWVGGKLVLDVWSSGAKNTSVVVSNLVGGQKYDIRLEYLDITSTAECHLLWSSRSQLKQPIQTSQLYTNSGPVIVSQPVSVVTTNGLSASFSIVTDPTQPVSSYQLLFNSNVVNTGVSPSFTLNNVQVAQAGYYQIAAINGSGSSTSTVAYLTVVAPATTGSGTGLNADYFNGVTAASAPNNTNSFTNAPVLTRLDSTVDASWGSYIADPAVSADNFAVRWTGQVQPQYSQVYSFVGRADDGLRVWVDGVLLIDRWGAGSSSTNSVATMPYAFTANQKYDIRVEFLEIGGNAEAHISWMSPSQPLTVIPTSQLYPQSGAYAIVHPKNTTVAAGGSTNMTVLGGGTGLVSYQWKKNGNNISGATTSVLSLPNVPYSDNGAVYSVIVSNSIGFRLSTNANLTVTSPPFITADPQPQTVPAGGTATFSVAVGGTPSFVYQWKKDGANITGATTSTLSITNVQNADVAGYSVGVTNSFGGVVSATAALTIGSGSAPSPTLGTIAVSGGSLNFSFSTVTGHNYTIQFKADLNAASWTDVETFAGTGGTVNKSYSVANGNGFYRILVQ